MQSFCVLRLTGVGAVVGRDAATFVQDRCFVWTLTPGHALRRAVGDANRTGARAPTAALLPHLPAIALLRRTRVLLDACAVVQHGEVEWAEALVGLRSGARCERVVAGSHAR